MPQTTTTITAQKVSVVSGLWQKLAPYLPLAIGCVLVIVIGILLWKILNKNKKFIQKDYDKENFKKRVKFLSQYPQRITSIKIPVILITFMLSLILSLVVTVILYFLKFMKVVNFIPAGIFTLIVTFIVIFFANNKPWRFSSYPILYNNKAEMVGYILTQPVKTPDGWKEFLFFNSMKYLFWQDIKIMRIPVSKKMSYLSDKKDEKGKRIKIVYKMPTDENKVWWINGNGNITINVSDFFESHKENIYYPLVANTADFNMVEVAFLKEKNDGDLLNIGDLANTARENALELVGGNPKVKLDNATQNKDSDNV